MMELNVEISRNEIIQNIFEEHIFKDVLTDLKILDSIQPEIYGNSCAVPTAMLIFSTLDFIGYMLREKGSWRDSSANIQVALRYKNYFPKSYEQLAKVAGKAYRHGMMHGFYPQEYNSQLYGIHKSKNKCLFENIPSPIGIIRSLNVNVLSEDFKIFINSLYEEIRTTQEKEFICRLHRSFKKLYPMETISVSTVTTQTTISPGDRQSSK